jgi:phosphocarrier protein HPr
MQHAKVTVPWREGLHLRYAVKLVKMARGFRSTILLKCDGEIADLRSIISILALCATMGTVIDVEVAGEDEQDAAQSVEQIFLG